jgi:hypothetical protein
VGPHNIIIRKLLTEQPMVLLISVIHLSGQNSYTARALGLEMFRDSYWEFHVRTFLIEPGYLRSSPPPATYSRCENQFS